MHEAELLLFWAKARPREGSRAACHPLIYHALDVAAVGEALLAERPDWLARLADRLELEADALRRLILFLLALHDIGKISRPFQGKAPEHWPTAVLGPMGEEAPGPRHDVAGLALLAHEIPDALEPVLGARDDVLAPFMGHHGRPVPRLMPKDYGPASLFGEPCRVQARVFVQVMHYLFAPPPLPTFPKGALPRVSWRLAGFAILADWIGSSQTWFPYEPPEHPAQDYRQIARRRARHAVVAAGLGRPPQPSQRTGFRAVAGFDEPSPVQRWAEEVKLPDGPVLALIEEVTGGGKTEAALVLAHRLMAAGRAQGLYVALPTMATANAMFARVEEACARLYAPGARPTLVLAHGRAELHAGFRDLTLPVGGRPSDDPEDERDASGAAAPAWLADDRRKAFLADLGVGTIDQALLAVLMARHQSLRLLGLADKVLIVDEAHAYDAYMQEELKRLLEFQAGLGGSTIVLSATLPLAVRRSLAAAFAKGLGQAAPTLEKQGYPMVTLVSGEGANEEGRAHRAELGRTLTFERLGSEDEADARIREAVEAGAAVAWVRNSVDDAIEAFERLRAAGVEADLFHARFAMGDRLVIEAEMVARFGKKGDPAKRRGVLVATQVIEQSLDLDFDLMVSDLAPADLLLQRAGRVWRHQRESRFQQEKGPRLLVLSPDPEGEVKRNWFTALLPRAGWVYRNHARLWLSAREVFARGAVRVPEDVRGLIEAVYGEGVEESAPKALERCWIESEGEEHSARAAAKMNLLGFTRGYGGDFEKGNAWPDDAVIPTRLGEPTVTLRLGRMEGGEVAPWCRNADPARAWALSEVTVRASRVKGVPEGTAEQAVKQGWARYDREKLLVVLRPDGSGMWIASIIDRKNAETKASYGLEFGLRLG